MVWSGNLIQHRRVPPYQNDSMRATAQKWVVDVAKPQKQDCLRASQWLCRTCIAILRWRGVPTLCDKFFFCTGNCRWNIIRFLLQHPRSSKNLEENAEDYSMLRRFSLLLLFLRSLAKIFNSCRKGDTQE